MLNVIRSFLKVANTRSLATVPSIAGARNHEQLSENRFVKPREVWISSLETEEENLEGIKTLHPKIFAATPRIDIIHSNLEWQRKYRFVSFAHAKLRFECRGKKLKFICTEPGSIVFCSLRWRSQAVASKRPWKSSPWINPIASVPWRRRRSRTKISDHTFLHASVLYPSSWTHDNSFCQTGTE